MKKHQPNSAAVLAIVAGLVLASAGTLVANGGAFFIPANRGPVDSSTSRASRTRGRGRPIQTKPYVNIAIRSAESTFRFRATVRDISGARTSARDQGRFQLRPIDTKQMEIMVTRSGL
jgi:hypothetical protein